MIFTNEATSPGWETAKGLYSTTPMEPNPLVNSTKSEYAGILDFMAEMTTFRRRFKELGVVLVLFSASRYSARLFQNQQRGEKLLGFMEKQAAFE